jgi:hypothetical protein
VISTSAFGQLAFDSVRWNDERNSDADRDDRGFHRAARKTQLPTANYNAATAEHDALDALVDGVTLVGSLLALERRGVAIPRLRTTPMFKVGLQQGFATGEMGFRAEFAQQQS